MVLLIGLISLSFSSVALGSDLDLDHDCNPRSWVQQFSAWWDPAKFWSAQPSAIQQEVQSRIQAYQIYLVQRQANVAIAATDRQKALIEQAAFEEQLRILGRKPPLSPEKSQQIDQVLAKADEQLEAARVHIDEVQRQGVENAIRWGEKCTAISQEQLAKSRR